jgi:hypothetical protein
MKASHQNIYRHKPIDINYLVFEAQSHKGLLKLCNHVLRSFATIQRLLVLVFKLTMLSIV